MSGHRKKKGHEEEHENHERWLVSYADFITLLFAFFVVMYSVSRVDSKKAQQVENSVRWAMHYEGTGGLNQMPLFEGPPSQGGFPVHVGQAAIIAPARQKVIDTFRRRVEKRVRPYVMDLKGPATAVTIQVEGQNLVIRLAAAHLFDPGGAALRPQVLPMIDALAEEVLPLGRPMRIEGHTDSRPVVGDRYRNNWDLSAARAASVAAYLESAHRVAPDRLGATGRAASKPIASDDTPEGQELNRRVELLLELDPEDPMLDRGG